MCISSRVRILNGRTFGDYQGKLTSYQYNGNSVIDYCLVSEDFIENVLYFHVDDPILRLSDHAKVSVRLLASVQVNCLKENLDNFPMKFKWETISPELFLNALKSDEVKVKIQDFENIQNQSQSEVDAALHSLHDILKMAANKSLKRKTKSRRNGIKSKPWFDKGLSSMRKELDHKSQMLAKYPKDPIIRGKFFKFRKLYGTKCKLQYCIDNISWILFKSWIIY
ncbi:unnamed protein product [Mytilus coruscus]|uniref:Endonuclease/exonuclease/phosphatase domain-containing protein n=1 Tax=Mytilus coruscus TaxID=42192 RepID=A0A6J8A8E3_MYTCO|nr:unnamed protein product [Mytilus coruscus]